MDVKRPVVHTSTVESSISATSSNLSSLARASSINCSGSESSRPHPGCSSATFHSDTLDANIEFGQFQHGVPLANCSASTAVLPSTPTTHSSPGDSSISQSTPQQPCNTLSGTGSRIRDPVSRAAIQSSSHWLSNTIGIVSLAASLSSLIFLGVRTYKLEVSQAINGALSACTSLIQANLTTPEASSSECKRIIAQGVTDSPYHLGKRALRHVSLSLMNLKRGKLYAFSSNFLKISKTFYLLFLTFTMVVLGAVLLAFARRRSRDGETLQSPARNDVLVTRHNEKGTETVAGQGVRVIKQNPDHNHYPSHLRRRIQPLRPEDKNGPGEVVPWQPINSSSDTLVNPLTGSNPSKVSITDRSANEKHEGLIELETTGDNKTFFDPETGEFIHLTPWRSPHKNDNESNDDHSNKAATRGDITRAFARMATGLGAWAGGKEVDDVLVRKITDAENNNLAQRAGDSLAGLVTNERPSGWPQTV